MYDLHIHSEYTIDSNYTMKEMAMAAMDKKAKIICFTDLIELNANKNKLDIKFRIQDYLNDITKVQYLSRGKLDIYKGIKIGMQPKLAKRYDKIIGNYPFDLVILSVHNINGVNIKKDKLFNTSNKTIDEIYIEYYSHILENIKVFKNFDVLSSIDSIDKHLFLQRGERLQKSTYMKVEPIIKEILLILINEDKALEVNTSNLRAGLNYFSPSISILNLYKDLGGDILVLGSGAKKPEDICNNFKSTKRNLKSLGFDYVYYYKNRKKIQILL